MKGFVYGLITRRFTETGLICILISLALTGLFVQEVAADTMESCFVNLSLGAFLYWILNVFMLRRCYFDLKDKSLYYLVNYASYAAFIFFGICIYYIGNKEVYAWLFSITKFARYSGYGISTFTSAMIFHTIMLITIYLSPIGMGWVFEKD